MSTLSKLFSSFLLLFLLGLCFTFYSCSEESDLINPHGSSSMNNAKKGGTINLGLASYDQKKGMLHFNSIKDLRTQADLLTKEKDIYDQTNMPQGGPGFVTEYPTLVEFTSTLGFKNNLLDKVELEDYNLLSKGTDPSKLPYRSLSNPVEMALLNTNGAVAIGKTIVVNPIDRDNVQYEIVSGRKQTLNSILAGVSPGALSDVIVHYTGPSGPNTECHADFTLSTVQSTKTVSVNYSGSPINSSNYTVTWNWGDNTPSASGANPGSHTYGTLGTFTITLTVEYDDGDPENYCYDSRSYNVELNPLDCTAGFSYTHNTGTAGSYTFVDNSSADANDQITEREWIINGQTYPGNLTSIVHVVPCDGEFTAVLTITTSTGCTDTYSEDFDVSSYECCGTAPKREASLAIDNTHKLEMVVRARQSFIFGKKVFGKSTAFRLKTNGNWKKEAREQRIDLFGEVYTHAANNCTCSTPLDIATTGIIENKKCVKTTYVVGGDYGTLQGFEWSANFFIDGQSTPFHTLTNSVVSCDL